MLINSLFLWKTAVAIFPFPLATFPNSLTNQKNVSHYCRWHFCFLLVECFTLSREEGISCRCIRRWLMYHFQLSNGNGRNLWVLVRWNSCNSCPPIASRVTLLTFADWQAEIRSWLVSTPANLKKNMFGNVSLPWEWFQEIKCMMVMHSTCGLFLTFTQKSCLYLQNVQSTNIYTMYKQPL